MRNYFTLDGVDSRDFGVYLTGSGTFNAPERALNFITVPGRSGDLIGTENRLENGTLRYQAFIYSNFKTAIAEFRAFLLSSSTYRRLEDTYNPDEYRLVAYSGGLEVTPTSRLDAGSFEIAFNCKPQRFLKSGETVQTFTEDRGILNATYFPAQPLLRIYGAGTCFVGRSWITISESDEYTDIDCATRRAYKGTVSRDNYVKFSTNDYPSLPARSHTWVLLRDAITRIDITPRWWTV